MAVSTNSKVRMFLPAVVLATSFYYSSRFTLGILIGYLIARIFCKMMGINEQNGHILLDLGSKWKLHFHHWIMGLIVLAIMWVIDFFYLPTFFAGVICGVIIQDIYDYNDWHKVIVRNETNKE